MFRKKYRVTWDSQQPGRQPLYRRMMMAQLKEEVAQAAKACRLGELTVELLSPWSSRRE